MRRNLKSGIASILSACVIGVSSLGSNGFAQEKNLGEKVIYAPAGKVTQVKEEDLKFKTDRMRIEAREGYYTKLSFSLETNTKEQHENTLLNESVVYFIPSMPLTSFSESNNELNFSVTATEKERVLAILNENTRFKQAFSRGDLQVYSIRGGGKNTSFKWESVNDISQGKKETNFLTRILGTFYYSGNLHDSEVRAAGVSDWYIKGANGEKKRITFFSEDIPTTISWREITGPWDCPSKGFFFCFSQIHGCLKSDADQNRDSKIREYYDNISFERDRMGNGTIYLDFGNEKAERINVSGSQQERSLVYFDNQSAKGIKLEKMTSEQFYEKYGMFHIKR
jgi:hypothetical protein